MFSQIAAKLASLTSPKSKPVIANKETSFIANQEIFDKILSRSLDEKELQKLSEDKKFKETLLQVIHGQEQDKLFLACSEIINPDTQFNTIFSKDYLTLEYFDVLNQHLTANQDQSGKEASSRLRTQYLKFGEGDYRTGCSERFYISEIRRKKYHRLFSADLEKIAADHASKLPEKHPGDEFPTARDDKEPEIQRPGMGCSYQSWEV